jgi:hypothetical protein
LLTDPFYKSGPRYSESSTGIRQFTYGSSYVAAGLAIKGVLQSAGWTVVDSAPSRAVQTRYAFYFGTAPGTGTPREMTPEECNNTRGPEWNRATAAGNTYNAYDPGAFIPTCPAGTGRIKWYPHGTTTGETAGNLMDKMNELGYWIGAVSGVIEDSGGPVSYELTFNSTAPAFEFDEIPIGAGSGDETMRRGYYTLRSPELDGAWLEIKIETRLVGNIGGFIYDSLGAMRICLAVTSSGGGREFYMPFFPGTYNICANNHQVVIWPIAGAASSRIENSSLLVSHIPPPEEHPADGIRGMVIGSDSGDFIATTDQLRQTLRWHESLASGYDGQLFATAYRAGNCDGYQKLAMLVRGTKNRPTASLAGQPLIEAPYVMLPSNPIAGPGPMIAGKLWDMVMTTGNAPVGKSMMYDGKQWTCFSTSVPVGDVLNDMWILG